LLKDQGISIAAAFDDQKHPSVTTTESGIPVLPLEILIPYITVNMVKFAIIATSGKDAQRMLDMLVLAGIKGVLNLTGTEIKAPKRCIINTISVVREFDKLIYFVKNSSDKKKVKK
jgi:redox-sensing transcriptional repressor